MFVVPSMVATSDSLTVLGMTSEALLAIEKPPFTFQPGSALVEAMLSAPAVTLVPPVWLLVPESVSVLAPSLTMPSGPLAVSARFSGTARSPAAVSKPKFAPETKLVVASISVISESTTPFCTARVAPAATE